MLLVAVPRADVMGLWSSRRNEFMEARKERRIGEHREANQRSGEGRRIDKGRRTWNRRHRARGGMIDGGKLDRRGAHPSFFGTLGFPVLRGVRRMGSTRRSGVMRRSSIRRCVDRRAP